MKNFGYDQTARAIKPFEKKIQNEPQQELGVLEPKVTAVGKLEGAVSMLQVAKASVKKIRLTLEEMQEFLKREADGEKDVPSSVINKHLTERITQAERHAMAASFQGRALLNGRSGIIARVNGEGLRFVKGSARCKSSQVGGYPVSIEQEGKPASLVGSERINEALLSEESLIAVSEGEQEVRYKLQRGESLESLTFNLQQSLWMGGLDVSVFISRDQRLVLMHNQLGSKHSFKAKSLTTRMLSPAAGYYKDSEPGQDVLGKIAGEAAMGEGGFLTGNPGNPRTDGLTLHYEGKPQYLGEIIGYVEIEQRGIIVPLEVTQRRQEILSLPSLMPEVLGLGAGNRSGIKSLQEIKGASWQERVDSQKVIHKALTELEAFKKELGWKEDAYVHRAIELLKAGSSHVGRPEDLMSLSKDKATQMAGELKGMLNAQEIKRISQR